MTWIPLAGRQGAAHRPQWQGLYATDTPWMNDTPRAENAPLIWSRVLMFAITLIMLRLLTAAIAPVADVVRAVVKGLAGFALASVVLLMLVVALAMST